MNALDTGDGGRKTKLGWLCCCLLKQFKNSVAILVVVAPDQCQQTAVGCRQPMNGDSLLAELQHAAGKVPHPLSEMQYCASIESIAPVEFGADTMGLASCDFVILNKNPRFSLYSHLRIDPPQSVVTGIILIQTLVPVNGATFPMHSSKSMHALQ